jgi:prepilin-type N-terminal cleavage/methylation domain-containing protein
MKFVPSNFNYATPPARRQTAFGIELFWTRITRSTLRCGQCAGARTPQRGVPTKKKTLSGRAPARPYRQYLGRGGNPCGRPPVPAEAGFTLVEILVSMALMSLIVLALMAVFNGTQTAFRAGLTQTDVLEPGRATMDLIKSDLETMTPSLGNNAAFGAVNFCVTTNFYTAGYSPLYQTLPASISGDPRTNVLESFFILSRGNVNGGDNWIGTGYAVITNSPDGSLYSLYRYTTNYPTMTTDPVQLFNNYYTNSLLYPTNGSHLMDGVVHLRVRAYDVNGALIGGPTTVIPADIYTNMLPGVPGETGVSFYSNAVPASVEVEMGVLEDSTLQHAEALNASYTAQTNYLAQHAGQVHIFRESIPIRNVDPTAYP